MLIIIHNIITAIASAPFELKGRGDDGEERGWKRPAVLRELHLTEHFYRLPQGNKYTK